MSQPDDRLGADEASECERTVVDAGVLSRLREQEVGPPRVGSDEPAVEDALRAPVVTAGAASVPDSATGPAVDARTLLLPAAQTAGLSVGASSHVQEERVPTAPLSIDELGDAFPDDAGDPAPAASSDAPAGGIDALGDAFPPSDTTDPQAAWSDDEAHRAAGSRCGPRPEEAASGVEAPGAAAAPLDALVAVIADDARAGAPSGATAMESVSLPGAVEDAWAEVDREQSWRSVTGGQVGSGARSTERDLGIGGQHTNVLRAGEAPRAEPPAILACIAGDDEGIELSLGSRSMMVGRAPSCELVLSDRSVSREHARLYYREQHYFVQDDGSGNGTFVNGARIHKQRLTSGDEVAFGRARFRFLEIGDVFKPADVVPPRAPRGASGPPQPLLWHGLVSVLILLSALVVVLAIVYVRRQDAAGGPHPAPYLVEGIAALNARQWGRAQAQFEILLAIEPTHLEGRRYLAVIEREKAYEKQLAAARASFGRGDLLQAYTQAAAITDSVYSAEAHELTESIEAELDHRSDLARAALEAGQSERALELLRVVDAIRPGRADVTALLDRARKPLARRRRETPPSERPVPRESAAALSDSPIVQQALRLFLAGEVGPALARLRVAGAGTEALAANMQRFDQVYGSAIVEHRAKRTAPAIRLLEQAASLEKEIAAGAPSVFKGEISRKLADMYYARGIEAALAERWAEARAAFEVAVSRDPGHASARHELDELASRAQALLEEAEALAATDRVQAKARYRLVLQLVPPSDGRHKKAQGRLDAMP